MHLHFMTFTSFRYHTTSMDTYWTFVMDFGLGAALIHIPEASSLFAVILQTRLICLSPHSWTCSASYILQLDNMYISICVPFSFILHAFPPSRMLSRTCRPLCVPVCG